MWVGLCSGSKLKDVRSVASSQGWLSACTKYEVYLLLPLNQYSAIIHRFINEIDRNGPFQARGTKEEKKKKKCTPVLNGEAGNNQAPSR